MSFDLTNHRGCEKDLKVPRVVRDLLVDVACPYDPTSPRRPTRRSHRRATVGGKGLTSPLSGRLASETEEDPVPPAPRVGRNLSCRVTDHASGPVRRSDVPLDPDPMSTPGVEPGVWERSWVVR